ncbi:hypothetical protein QTP70_003207 [Hemibagrus guttatus]|uniref:Reverse transcriptase/retrotransposon-derived protein RNase H-like domain-containing protein n=1 Tax=Hemibagrus guttatus TaxID=175788 RepID=A0AAE0Q5A5_9TELE|nr:hypothetical protein QTP70_003207 [Hemibagrus guttatus]
MEVDAYDLGVEAMLSQRANKDNVLHPCAFFSHRLTLAKQNYAIGNGSSLSSSSPWTSGWRAQSNPSSFGLTTVIWSTSRWPYIDILAKPFGDPFSDSSIFFLSYHPGTKNGKNGNALPRLHISDKG